MDDFYIEETKEYFRTLGFIERLYCLDNYDDNLEVNTSNSSSNAIS